MYKLFLDDERYPAERHEDAIIIRTCEEAIEYVKEHGIPDMVMLDHDLGYGIATGYDFVKFLVDYCIEHDHSTHMIMFSVHSMNPVGVRNMEQLWWGFMKHYDSSRGEDV